MGNILISIHLLFVTILLFNVPVFAFDEVAEEEVEEILWKARKKAARAYAASEGEHYHNVTNAAAYRVCCEQSQTIQDDKAAQCVPLLEKNGDISTTKKSKLKKLLHFAKRDIGICLMIPMLPVLIPMAHKGGLTP